jgi:hypothetical protein
MSLPALSRLICAVTSVASFGRRAALPSLLLAGVTILLGGHLALAAFTGEAQSEATIATATLAPPKPVAAVQVNCQRNGAVEIELSWSPSSSSYVSSYSLERSNSATGSYAKLASVPSNTTSYTDTSQLASTTTYFYRVSALYMSWSASTTTSIGTLNKQCR